MPRLRRWIAAGALLCGILAGPGLPPVIADAWEKQLLVYAPLDGHTELRLGSGLWVPGEFTRLSPAVDDQGQQVDWHEPRFPTGRFGQSLFLEAGDHGEFTRGTANLLPPPASVARIGPAGLRALGDAALRRSEHLGPAGNPALAVQATSAGGVITPPVELPQIMRYIGSVFVRAAEPASEGVTLRLQLDDGTNGQTFASEQTLTAQWQRLTVVMPYSERDGQYEGKPLQNPGQVTMSLRVETQSLFEIDGLMLEQAGIHYTNRLSASSWIPGRMARRFEQWRLPASREHFDPRQGTIAFWVRLAPGTMSRTLLAVGNGWQYPIHLQQRDRLDLQFGEARRFFPPLAEDAWHHVALTWQNQQAHLFLAGKRISTLIGVDLNPEQFNHHRAFLLPGAAHGEAAHAPRTSVNGAIDELAVWSRALSEAELATLAAREEPLLAAPAISLRMDTRQRAFGREAMSTPLRMTLRNHTAEPQTGVTLHFHLGTEHTTTLGPLDLPPHGSESVTYPFPTGRLMPGDYPLTVRGGPTAASQGASQLLPRLATLDLRVTPFRDPDRLPILAWGFASSERELEQFASVGVTVAPTGLSAHPLDRAADLGMHGMAQFGSRQILPQAQDAFDRILDASGRLGSTNTASPPMQAQIREESARFALALRDLPGLSQIIVNTEWHPPMGFSPAFRQQVAERFGLDLTHWMSDGPSSWRITHPDNRLSPTRLPETQRPTNGIIPDADPFYQFHRWWHQGVANEVPFNRLISDAIRQQRPDITRIHEPILRAPAIQRYLDAFEIAQEWFYYEEPATAIQTQERLAAISEGLPMRPAGMPQFLIKGGRDVGPFEFTPPPDLMRTAFWLVASRPMDQLSLWGWHRVFPGENHTMMTAEQLQQTFGGLEGDALRQKVSQTRTGGLWIPELPDHIAAFAREVWQPYGPLFRAWRNHPRSIAVVQSFASQLYGDDRWTQLGWITDALSESGLPYDILWDDTFFRRQQPLAGYRVVVLPRTTHLPQQVISHLKAFVRRGGVVVVDERWTIDLNGPVHRFRAADSSQAMQLIRDRADLPVQVQGEEALWNLLELDGTHYLMVVNNRRESGPYLGPWGKVRDKGMPNQVTVRWSAAALGQVACDLLSSDHPHITAAADTRAITLPLEAAGSRLIALTDRLPQALALTPGQQTLSRDAMQSVTLRLTDGQNDRVPLTAPVRIDLIRPDGSRDDLSRHLLLRQGEATLALPIPLNAPTGTWHLSASSPVVSGSVQTTFQVQ